MAKIQLTAETLSPNRRKPGFGLLKVTGWAYSPAQTKMAIQRSEDEKYLGTNAQWEPIPVWQSLENMLATDNEVLEGDVGPALVDPIINAPNNSYRVTLKCGSETETRTLKIDGAVLSSSASGSAPDSSALAEGFILGDSDKISTIETKDIPVEEAIEIEPQPQPQPQQEEKRTNNEKTVVEPPEPGKPGFFARNKIRLVILSVLLILGIAVAAAWFFKWPPFNEPPAAGSTVNPAPQDETPEPKPDGAALTDLQLLSQFMATQPSAESILAKAKEWRETDHCEAMLRLMVYSGHKSNDAQIALTYAKMYDPNLFQAGPCVAKADKDTAKYWYEKAKDAGNAEAVELLKKLE